MELKDRLEALKFISQVHRSQFNERRRYEWKIVFTSLTFYVLCVAATYGGWVSIPSNWEFKLGIWIMFLALAVAVATFLSSLHTANNMNKTFAQRAEDAIADMLDGKERETLSLFSNPNIRVSWDTLLKRNIGGMWAWRWQVLTLLVFAITSALFLTLK